MNEQSDSDETVGTQEAQKESMLRRLPMHARLMAMAQVRYVFGVIGHLTSMVVFTAIVGLFIMRSVDVPIEKIEERVREASISALGFVFPDYISEVSSVGLDLDPVKKGWMKVNNITLLDIVQNRSIFIDEFRMSPSIRGLLTGDFRFSYIGASKTEIQFQTTETENRSRFGYPINLLDIPANVLRDGGQVILEDLTMIVSNASDVEMVAVKNLEASLIKNQNGYDGRIAARHADKDAGAFSFRVQREGEKVSWQGNAREYKVTPDKKLGVDFDLDLVFDDVPDYDLTEQTDNVRYPYRFLTKADGLARVKFADWVGGGRFEFDPDTKVLSLAEMSLAGGDYSFDGEVDLTVGDEMLITGKGIALSYPTNLDQTLIENLSFVGKLDLLKRQFQLGEIFVTDGPFELRGKGSVGFEEKLRAQFTVETSQISRDKIIDYWPKDIAQKTFDWASSNIEQAEFENVRFDALYQDEFAFDFSMVGRDVILKPTKWLPRIQSDFVRLNFTDKHLLITSPTAGVANKTIANVDFSDIQFFVPSLEEKPWDATLDTRFAGGISDVMNVLSQDPIRVPSRINMASSRFSGNATGTVNTTFPLRAQTPLSDIDLNVKAKVTNFGLSKLVNNKNLSAKSIDVAVDERGMRVAGNVALDKLSGSVNFEQSFARGSKPDITVKGRATKAQLASIGLKLPSLITGDGIGYDARIVPSSGNIQIRGDADISSLGLVVAGLGTAKPVGRAGTASFNVNATGRNVNVDQLSIRSGDLSATGSLKVAAGKFEGLNFTKVNWPSKYSGGLNVDRNLNITLQNGTVNLVGLSPSGAGASSNQNVTFKNSLIRLTNNIHFTNVDGQVKLGKTITGNLTGRLNERSNVQVKLSPSKGETLATVTSSNAGQALKGTGFFGDLLGGNLALKIRTTDRNGLYAGNFRVTNARLSNSRTAGQLLQAASIFGALNDKGLNLDEISGDLLIQSDRIDLFSGHAYGPEIGLTLGGSYYPKSKKVTLVGVLTPAYLLNGAFQKIPGLGELLGGNVGEGVFGVTYQIQGASPNYNITANPLSLLTPGKFREIWSMVPQARAIPQQYRVD